MRVRFLSVLILLGMTATAFAQGPEPPIRVWQHHSLPYPTRFSLELGTGFFPLHMLFLNHSVDISDEGKGADAELRHFSALSLSGVYRSSWRSEFVLTGGLSWIPYQITQYGVFGIDPAGKPRYDLDIKEAMWTEYDYVPSLTLSYRYIWNPGQAVEWYSGFGLGLIYRSELTCLPGLTIIGLRYGMEHVYFFAENTFSPIATLIHGGLGWRF